MVEKGKGIKMQWCYIFMGDWKAAEKFRRLEQAAAVLFLLILIMGWVWSVEGELPVFGSGHAANVVEEPAGMLSPGEGSVVPEIPPAAISMGLNPASGCVSAALRTGAEEISPASGISAEESAVEPEIPMKILIPETGSGEETVPAEPEAPVETVPALPENGSGSIPQETLPTTVNGFVVDASGMICGIAGISGVMEETLVLPSEGCSGIAAGAFADAPAGITEIYIPANIISIAPGSLGELADLEWIEAEASEYYFTEDGVLFSENGTCILGFPSARTGNYKVPSRVTRFAEGVFENARIEVIDAVECSLENTGDLPSHIRLLEAGKLAG